MGNTEIVWQKNINAVFWKPTFSHSIPAEGEAGKLALALQVAIVVRQILPLGLNPHPSLASRSPADMKPDDALRESPKANTCATMKKSPNDEVAYLQIIVKTFVRFEEFSYEGQMSFNYRVTLHILKIWKLLFKSCAWCNHTLL